MASGRADQHCDDDDGKAVVVTSEPSMVDEFLFQFQGKRNS